MLSLSRALIINLLVLGAANSFAARSGLQQQRPLVARHGDEVVISPDATDADLEVLKTNARR